FRALMVRIDATKKLVNVKLFEKGLAGLLILPAKDFDLVAGKADATGAAGRIHTKAPSTFEGTTVVLDATFDAVIASAPAAQAAPAAAPAPAAVPDRSVALNQLLLKHLTFTPNDFLTAVAGLQTDNVKLYLDAGMAPDTPGGQGTPLFGAKTPLV